MVITTAGPRNGIGGWFAGLMFALPVGTAFVIASLPDGTASLARRDGWDWLTEPARWSKNFASEVLPNFPDLLTWITYALAAYVGALLLLAMRHGRPRLFIFGLVVLVVATFLLHLLAYIGVIVFSVGAFVVGIFTFVTGSFDGIGVTIWVFLGNTVLAAFEPVFGGWAWLPAVLLLALILGLAFRFGPEWLKVTVGVLVFVLVFIAVVGVVFAGIELLVGLVPSSFWGAAGSVLGLVVGILVVGLILATVGQLFLDQLRSTMLAGSNVLGVVMGAIAVGSTLALLMLVGNVYGTYDLYPDSIAHWAQTSVRSNDEPQFDATVTLAVVALSTLGILRNLIRMRPSPDMAVFRSSLIYFIMGVIAAGMIAAVGKETERS